MVNLASTPYCVLFSIEEYRKQSESTIAISFFIGTKLLQKSEMRKVIVIELSYKGFS